MKKYFVLFVSILLFSLSVGAQQPSATPARPRTDLLDVAQYGVQVEADQRLILMMAALEAAGFDVAPGREASAFRAQVRQDFKDLEPDLRTRLHKFVTDHNRELTAEYDPRLKAATTTGERADLASQFAARAVERYISLAYALGPAPVFEMPPRSDDLPGGVLEILDFTPLLREFYRKARMDERLTEYTRQYRTAGDAMRPELANLVRSVLSYLHTQPLTTTIERKEVRAPGNNKKNAPKRITTREYERRFIVVPDLLAVPGAINLRVIADDYYVIVPADITPASSEMRRAYLQYVADPLTLRFGKDIALRREDLKKLLEERRAAGRSVTPDVFLAVARSLIIAAEVRMNEATRANALVFQINTEKDVAQRSALLKQLRAAQATLSDESVRQLALAYDNGAVLAFYFAEQLKGLEASGFDIAGLLPDMLASFDLARESKRLEENAAARQRAELARIAQLKAAPENSNAALTGRPLLFKRLNEVEQLLNQKSYAAAETQLKELLTQFPGEPRIFFALGRVASGSAQDAIDETVQEQRLSTALGHFRLAVEKAAPDTDKAMLSRAHYLMGRIYEHFDRKEDALKEFELTINLGPVTGGELEAARQGKARLAQPQP